MADARAGDGPGAHPARWRWAGAAASVVLAGASWGAGARPELNTAINWPGVAWWRDTGGSPLLATVCVLALAGLVLAWWRLRRAAVSVRWWWATAALWFVPLVASVPLSSRDLYSYAAQGALWADGLTPYEHTVSELESGWRDSTAPTWLDTPTPYGPVWLAIARGAAVVSGGHLGVALLILRLVAAAAVVVLAWAVADVAGRLGTHPVRATWLAVACPLVGVHFVSGAHNDALMVAAVLGGFALALRGRFVAACVVVALGAMVKVTAVVVLPFIVVLWASVGGPWASARGAREAADTVGRARVTWPGLARAGASVVGVAAVAIVLVVALTGLGFAWLNPGATPGRNEQWTSLPTGLGIAVGAVGHVLGHDDWRDPAIAAFRAVALGLLVVLLVLVWLGSAKPAADTLPPAASPGGMASVEERARVVRASGWALLAVVVLAPVFLPWYYLWVLAVLAVSLGRSRQRTETALAVAATVVCFMTLPEGYSLGLTTTAVGVPIDVVVAVLLVRLGVRTARRLDRRHLLEIGHPLLTPADASGSRGGSAATHQGPEPR